MVTTYPETKTRVDESSTTTSQVDELGSAWVIAYREDHPQADLWAAGFGAIEHSDETQGRVFRMAEQLVARGVNRTSIFAALRRADAAASRLPVGKSSTSRDARSPVAFEEELGRTGQPCLPQPQQGPMIIFVDTKPRLEHLRANGFDPITFDGADPAAYAWVMFELAARTEAAATQLRCECHPTFRPTPVGVAIDGSSRSLTRADLLVSRRA